MPSRLSGVPSLEGVVYFTLQEDDGLGRSAEESRGRRSGRDVEVLHRGLPGHQSVSLSSTLTSDVEILVKKVCVIVGTTLLEFGHKGQVIRCLRFSCVGQERDGREDALFVPGQKSCCD